MSTWITRFSLDTSRFSLLVIIGIAIAGIVSFTTHPSLEDPEITIREAVVTASFPGMSPRRIEELITLKLEEKIREIPEVKHIKSSSKPGTSIIHVSVYDRYFDLQPIWDDLRNKMDEIKQHLPSGTSGPNVNSDFGLVAVASIAMTAEGFTLEEMRVTARDLRTALYAVAGVKRVELFGVQPERIYLETTNAQLAQFGLTPAALINTLATQNIVQSGGKVDADGRDIIIEPSGNFTTLKDLENVVLAVPASQKVAYLRDIVNIRRTFVDPPEKPVYYNGKPAIVLAVSMQGGRDIVAFGKTLSARVEALESSLPVGYVLSFATYQPGIVKTSIADFSSNLYQTIAVVLVVVMLFLGWRTGLIVGVMVPLVMLASMLVMRMIDIEIHRVSVGALIISLGLLVDNGVVLAEDIKRRIGEGMDRRAAAIAAGGDLAAPLLSSSLTTIFAFLPLALADNVTGEFVGSLSIVIGITLLVSWLFALYVTPLMCFWFIEPPSAAELARARTQYDRGIYPYYKRLLGLTLRHRGVFVVLMLVLLAVAIWGFQFVVKQFFPQSDRAEFTVYLDLPAGTSARETNRVVRRFAGWLNDEKTNPEALDSIAYVAAGGPRYVLSLAPIDPDPHRAFVLVRTKSVAGVETMLARTRDHLLTRFPEVKARVKKLSTGASEIGLVEVRFIGSDLAALKDLSTRLQDRLRQIPGTVDIRDDWENRVLKLLVKVDQARARRAGVTSQEIASSLKTFLSGDEITQFRDGDKSIPIVLRAEDSERVMLDRIGTISVYSATRGTNVPLLQVATFGAKWEFGHIRRRDLERTITVSAKHVTLQAGQLLQRIAPQIAALGLPPGYRIEYGGEAESSAEAQGALFGNLPLAGALIVLILVLQFNSFRRPLIILATIPLTLIGAVAGLVATQALFGFLGMLGLLSLAGIIINNAIVLIDRIDQDIKAGVDPYEAVTGAAVLRFRPIVMTTLTTIVGLLPLTFFGGAFWFAMANIISFGLGVGTVLTLLFVPALYTLLFRVPVPATAAMPPRIPARADDEG